MVIPEGLAFGSRANEQIRIVQIGCGGRGSWFVQAIPQIGERHVAMCDVDQNRASESFRKMPDVPKFTDYRKMLEEKDKEIDAVIVAAPDHIHAPAGVLAMRMGKPLYCEKPLTNTINEAHVMRRVPTKPEWPPRWATRERQPTRFASRLKFSKPAVWEKCARCMCGI